MVNVKVSSKVGQRSRSSREFKIYGTAGKALSWGTHMPNMNALSLRIKIVAAFLGMHVLPAKQAMPDYQESVTTGQTDTGQSDSYVPLCFAGDTNELWPMLKFLKSRSKVTIKVTCSKFMVPLERPCHKEHTRQIWKPYLLTQISVLVVRRLRSLGGNHH